MIDIGHVQADVATVCRNMILEPASGREIGALLKQSRVSSDGAAGLQAWVTIEVAGSNEVFRSAAAVLANGEIETLDLYFAFIEWHGQVRPVMVHQAGGRPLMGMALLSGSSLLVEASEGGEVT